ncbi:MAG: hypothetical protein CMK70_01970 [Pseudohongiella sp.]|nr:hypothetical protein [Pseudohongiella sp.]|tara:strand:- start:5945 stop:7672 length:1728 start_codon:yes stop_codon:yes gene_type:complete
MRLLLSFAFALIVALPATDAQAQVPKRASKDYAINHSMRNVNDTRLQPYAGLELSGSFDIWYLLGEPVVNCTARWTNPGVLQVVLDDGTRVLSEPGEEAMWNLMLMAQFPDPNKDARRLTNGGGAHLSVFCDAGEVAQNGRNGFNVAGSPNWDKFICSTPKKIDTRDMFDIDRKQQDQCASVGGRWLSPAEAKNAAVAGLNIDEVMVLSVELSAGDTLRRAEKMLWRKKSFDRKYAKAQDLQARLAQKGLNEGIDAARRIYNAISGSGTYPTAAHLDEMDSLLDALRAELRDDVAEFNDDWRVRDQALVSAQLERVAEIDHSLRAREAELEAYRTMLAERAKNAPDGPRNPLEEYIVAEHTLEPFLSPYSNDHGLKNKAGHVVVEPKGRLYRPLVGDSGTKYDLYIGNADSFYGTYWIVDKHGNRLGLEFYRGYPRFHEELGLITFAAGDDYSSAAHLSVYSPAEKRVLFDSQQTPIGDGYRNKQLIRTRDQSGKTDTWHRDYTMSLYHIRIAGRSVIYGLAIGNSPYKFENECTAITEEGEKQGVMPAFMYDLETNQLLRPSEHLCVPNPTAGW